MSTVFPTNHKAREDLERRFFRAELTVHSQHRLEKEKLLSQQKHRGNPTEVTRVFDWIKLNSITWFNHDAWNRFSSPERKEAQSGRWRWGRWGGGPLCKMGNCACLRVIWGGLMAVRWRFLLTNTPSWWPGSKRSGLYFNFCQGWLCAGSHGTQWSFCCNTSLKH